MQWAPFGAPVAGLLIVPVIGLQNTLYLGAFLSLIAGLLVLLQSSEFNKDRKLTVGALSSPFVIFFVLSTDPWAPRMISTGIYIYAKNYFNAANNFQQLAAERDDVQMASRSAIWEAAMKN